MRMPDRQDWTTLPAPKNGEAIPEMYKRGKQLQAAVTGKNQLRPGSEAVPEAINKLAAALFRSL